MLTAISNISAASGYPGQQSPSQTLLPQPSPAPETRADDKVSLARKENQIEQTHNRKKSTLEQNYNSQAQKLEREYLQNKSQLEKEFQRKKQALGIDLYA